MVCLVLAWTLRLTHYCRSWTVCTGNVCAGLASAWPSTCWLPMVSLLPHKGFRPCSQELYTPYCKPGSLASFLQGPLPMLPAQPHMTRV